MVVRTVAAPPSIVVMYGGGSSSCGRLWCCSGRVVCCVVLFVLCVCVCDLFLSIPTPMLWRGAAGLCARVRACAGAAESLHTYIHAYLYFLYCNCATTYTCNHTCIYTYIMRINMHIHSLLVSTPRPYVGNPGFGIHCHPLDSVNPDFN